MQYSRRAFLKGATGATGAVGATGTLGLSSLLWSPDAKAVGVEHTGALPDVPRRANRGTVRTQQGMVACAQPIASMVGVDVLQQGGNAMDAAIAMAATLNVVDPSMTGIGGDAFFFHYSSKDKKLSALNACGRAPYEATIEAYRERGYTSMPAVGPLAVTVPGALNGWARGLERFGTMSLADVLQPAIRYAERGFPVNRMTNFFYHLRGNDILRKFPASVENYLPDGKIPEEGDVLIQKNLAQSLRLIAEKGSDIFYKGELGQRVVNAMRASGGLLSEKDLADHQSNWVEPLRNNYRDVTVYELPPNTQGIALLQQLAILEGFDLASMHPEDPKKLHLQIETAKLAFADLRKYVSDPAFVDIPVNGLLSSEYIRGRRALIDPDVAAQHVTAGMPEQENTTYVSVVDRHGSVVSFMNSLRNPFGSGFVAGDTGILLQNRGKDFSLDPNSVNRLEPHKRTLHTLNPIMVFKGGNPYLSMGCVGGHQQTQGLQQVLVNHVDSDYEIQQAIEGPRWSLSEEGVVHIEPALEHAKDALESMGHRIVIGKTFFGGTQIVRLDPDSSVLGGGSDPRLDGAAMGY